MSSAAGGLSGIGAGILTDPTQADDSPQSSTYKKQDGEGENQKPDPNEEALVAKLWKVYERSRKFDEPFRKQVASDRRYAAGTSDLSWAVTTNLIGAFIDILVALLYARDPDVSVKKAAQVDNSHTSDMDAFAETLEIVISYLWRSASLKKVARKAVRSVLSNSEGWLKANFITDNEPEPETETALNSARETMDHLQAQLKLLEDPDDKSPEEIEALVAEKKALIEELEAKIEMTVTKMFAIDFVRTERIQVSLDVDAIEDYRDADWIADEFFVCEDEVLDKFPRLEKEDITAARKFHMNPPKDLTDSKVDQIYPQGQVTAEQAQAFTEHTSAQESPAFLKCIEIWDRRDKHIRTIIEGVKKWAKEPFTPPYPTRRFFPYFYFAFYEVDGNRHAQSLSWRLYKLQDEYSTTRSNFRLARERSLPGVFVDGTNLDDIEMRKVEASRINEYTVLRPTDPTKPIGNSFAGKPVPAIDARLYDPTYILNDMERLSGVQEALSSAINGPGNPKTATEANIQQAGTSARTTSDRDNLEFMLTDLARATAEQALRCLTYRDAARIAGKKAFWPEGMSIDDLFTLVEIDIQAGSTGKPKQATDQQAWATLLPIIRELIGVVRQALASGDLTTANVNIELIKTTMKILGDDEDPERLIPRIPPPGSKGSGAPPPPVTPEVKVSLTGMISPAIAAQLAAPAIAQDAASMSPAPGAAPPGGPLAPPAAGPPGAGP